MDVAEDCVANKDGLGIDIGGEGDDADGTGRLNIDDVEILIGAKASDW